MSALFVFLLHVYQVFILLFICALILGSILIRRDRRRRAAQGFWVEHISGIPLGGAPDDFAVVYHEGEQWQFFYGKIQRAASAEATDEENLLVPDEEQWRQHVPEWLQSKRELVLQRIKREHPHIQLVTQTEYPTEYVPTDEHREPRMKANE